MKKLFFAVTNDLNSDQRMWRICSSLQAANYEVSLYGRALPQSRPLPKRAYQQTRQTHWFTQGALFYLEFNLRLFFKALQQDADAFCAVDLDSLIALRFAAILRNKPLVYDAHEIFTEVPELLANPLKKKVWQWVEKLLIPGIKHAYTVNQSLAQWYARQYGIQMKVVRNMPFAVQHESQPCEGFILYQGALNAGRGIEPLLLAMKLLPNERLVIAGRGDLDEQLRKMSVQNGLGDRVQFTGQLEPEALRQLSARAWLGVNLLESKSLNYYYSLANKFFDYAQAEIPQLCMDFPEYRILNETYEVALLCKDLEPELLARQIRDLRESPETYARLKENSKQAAQAWLWKYEEPVLLEVYQGVFGV
jgi:glycosyltransferase involved in cell wall biosynthesis